MSFPTNEYKGSTLDYTLAKSLPLLPGLTFNLNIGAERFNKPGHWALSKGIPVLADRDAPRPKPGIGGIDPPPWAPIRSYQDTSIYPRGEGPKVPSWIAFDKQVLAFTAYFQEPIPESAEENYRVHQCKILYYLEDDTVQVLEPRTLNAGVPQGQIIRRHRIPLPPPCEDQFYTIQHFNVGCEIQIYGKIFFICGCDKFTRNFLNRLGIPVVPDMELPTDKATEKRKDIKTSLFARKPHQCADTRGRFLQHDRHVLRFWGYWDDRCNLNGDLRQFVIHYFLSNQTMEVREIIRPNSGYDSFPVFIKRGKIPKNVEKLVPLPGQESPLTILNVFGSMHGTKNKKAHFMVDNLGLGARDIEYYQDTDLAIGAVLNILGRAITLTDCDEFTRTYYREKYDIKEFTPLILNEENNEPPKIEYPPYTGWGTEEDSLVSCKSLEMKPFVKDYRKIAEKENDILRFEAKFYNALQRVNASRKFTINYYMSDNTIQVFEKEHPNSGLPKGNFLLRNRVKKPGSQPEFGVDTEYYEPKDFFVGNILDINSFQFQLVNADEFTYSYMEANKHLFPFANICLCLNKFRECIGPCQAEDVLKRFSENDTCLQGVMDLRNFRDVLLEISKCAMSEHEILTISRAYAANTPLPGPDYQTLQAICQTELRRFNFDKALLARVEYTFRYHDPCRSGKVDRETLRATLKGARLPIFKDLLDFLVDKFPMAEGDLCNRVDYCQLLHFLNWENNPAPVTKPAAIQCAMKWVNPKPPMKIFCVNYRAFLDDVCPNIKCSLPAVCCCNQCLPCQQHPLGTSEKTGYCPQKVTEEIGLEECPPQEPITVHLQPCQVTYTQGQNHKCSPGALTCNDEQNQSNEGQDNCCN